MNCKITQQLLSMMKTVQDEQKQPRDYGIGQLLFHSEISFLDAVAHCPGAKVSAIANYLDITRGAATQQAAKLESKGLVEIYRQQENKKEKYLRLTPLGGAALEGHERYHQQANLNLCQYYCSLNPAETATILTFLTQLENNAPFCDFTCVDYHHLLDIERMKANG